MNELAMELDRTKLGHTEDNFKAVCDQVVVHWKSLAERYLDSGYATGEYRDSIHRETVRATRAQGGNRGGWKSRAVTYDEVAHLIEYGTGKDKKGVGVWFDKSGEWRKSPKTPTPAFGIAAQVELDFNETIAKRGKRQRRESYPSINRRTQPEGLRLTNQERAELYAAGDWP